MENDTAQAAASSIDWSAISKVYHNLPVIFRFLVTWADINKEFSSHELIQLYKVCQDIAWLLRNETMKAIVYDCLGDLYYKIRRFKDAMDCYKELLELCKRTICTERGIAEAHIGIGNVHWSRGEYQEATACYKKCLKIFQQTGDLAGQSAAHNGIGNVHRSRCEYKEAMGCYEKSLKICQQTGDLAGEATVHNEIGNVHMYHGEINEAMECYKKCLKICQRISDLAGEGNAHHGIGNVHRSRCEYKEAMGCYEKSLKICQQTVDSAGERTAYNGIGCVHKSRGEYKEAMECYEKSLKICQQRGDLAGEGDAHNHIGNVHFSRGEFNEAMECFNMSLKVCQQTDDLAKEGVVINNIGNVHLTRGDYTEAMECFKKCLKKDDLAGKKKAHNNIGNVHLLRGEYQDAIACYVKFFKMCQQTDDLAGEGTAYHNIGYVHHSLGEYKDAIECYKKDLKICQQTGDLASEAKNHKTIGISCISLLEWCAAESHFRESLRCYKNIFSRLSQHDQSKVSIVDTYIDTYQALTLVLLKVENIKEALLITERGRSQALRDKLLEKYEIATDVCTVVDYSDVGSLISSNDSTFIVFSLSHVHDYLYTFIACLTEKVYFEALSRDSRIVRDHQGKNVETVIDSCVTKIIEDANVHVHQNRENTFEDRSMGQDDADVCEKEQLTRESNTPQQEHEEDVNSPISGEDLLKDLYQALIAPINDQLVEPEIVIIPDGPLFLLPFAALQSPDGQFLSDTKRIRTGPSLTTLKLLKEYPLEKQSKTGALIVGGPIVRNVMYRGGFRKGFGDLPGAWEEATEIGKILNETPLTKESATKEEVMRRLQEGVAVIHIATHGNANTGELLLAPAPYIYQRHIPTEDDYMLTVKDISSCKINAQLVVLSCCHSGLGQVRAEGVVGLTRAFLAAGARSVLAALWEISDEGTLFFMMSFYGHLKRGESACTSLQEAMREMRRHPRWSHPYYWGSFFIVGHDVTI